MATSRDGINPDPATHPMLPMGYGLNELAEVPVREGQPRGAWVVYGGQVGSEGKGAVAGYLARKHRWGASICTFMTNAGHTFVEDDGRAFVVQQLPMAVVSESVEHLIIAPGSAITPEKLFEEIQYFDDLGFNVSSRLRVHPNAVIIEPEDRKYEEALRSRNGSTAKGCGSALARKVRRDQDVRLAKDYKPLAEFITDTSLLVNDLLDDGKGVLVEAAQGFDLDINHCIEYPYCTSRGTTPMQVMADCGIDGRMVMRNIAVIRTFPIRVAGPSGPYGGQELSWDDVSQSAGRPVTEKTTVTQKTRRVFEIDLPRLGYMSRLTRPTDIALTFADYVEPELANAGQDLLRDLPRYRKLTRMIWNIENAMRRKTARPRVRLIKTGPKNAAMIDMMGPNTVLLEPPSEKPLTLPPT